MQCKKCEIEVPSQFEYVLAKNVCPKCGNKLMADQAMAVYLDLKKRLHEVEFVMDKTTVCERVAMFVVTNYQIVPSGGLLPPKAESPVESKPAMDPPPPPTPQTAAEKAAEDAAAIAKFKAELAAIAAGDDGDLTADEIRAEEAARAEELAIAREIGMDPDLDIDLEDTEEAISGMVDPDRVQRLKKLAATTRMSKSGQIGKIKRTTP